MRIAGQGILVSRRTSIIAVAVPAGLGGGGFLTFLSVSLLASRGGGERDRGLYLEPLSCEEARLLDSVSYGLYRDESIR